MNGYLHKITIRIKKLPVVREKQMLQRGYGKDCKSMKKWQESNKDENMKLFVTAFSKKAKMRYCRSFNEESRTNIFTHFWKMTWDMKKETYLV